MARESAMANNEPLGTGPKWCWYEILNKARSSGVDWGLFLMVSQDKNLCGTLFSSFIVQYRNKFNGDPVKNLLMDKNLLFG